MSVPTPDPRRWWALALLCAAQFIVILDTSIIGIALPAIQRALDFNAANLQWVFNAYVVVFGGLLLLGGRLADLFSQRRMFISGFAILTLASLLTGLAWSDGIMIVGRGLQGLGAALIAPAALAIVMSLFTDPREMARALGFWGASAAAGGTAGVFLGGVITQWLSWRWVFLINVPLGLIVLAASPLLLPRGLQRRGAIDYAGALSVTGAIVLAVYAIVTAEHAGWASLQTIGLLVVSILLLRGFVALQRRRAEPLVPLQIFSVPNLAMSNIVMGLLGAAWIPLWFFLNLYLQQVLGYSALQGGLALLPMTGLLMVLMAGVTERIVARLGVKATLILGLVLLGVSMAWFTLAPVGGRFVLHVLPASLVGAVGMSLAYIPAMMSGMGGAKPQEMGLASGLINTSYQIGSALGLAATVAVSNAVISAGAALEPPDSLNNGFHAAFWGAALITAVNVVLAWASLRSANASSGEGKKAMPLA